MNRFKRLACRALVAGVLLAPIAALPAGAATVSAAIPVRNCPTSITQADSGKTIPLVLGSCATLTLDGGLNWTQPQVSGTSVVVVPIPSCLNSTPPCLSPASPATAPPQSWDVLTEHGGVSTITSLGYPVCSPGVVCPQFVVLFQVTIDVILPPPAA